MSQDNIDENAADSKKKVIIVRCPNCRKSIQYDTTNEFRPFCSRACSDRDIIAWANEEYAVAGRPAEPEELAAELQKNKE